MALVNYHSIVAGKKIDITAQRQALNPNPNVESGPSGLTNQADALIQAPELRVKAAQLSNNGAIKSNDVVIEVAGQMNNQGLIDGGQLNLSAQSIDNRPNAIISSTDTQIQAETVNNRGTIEGQTTRVSASKVIANEAAGRLLGKQLNIRTYELNNYGLIDGQTTHLVTTGLAFNRGAGRLMGNQLLMDVDQINNIGANALVAGREHIEMGANSLVNRERAYLISGGDMVIGRHLNEEGRAIGHASSVDNIGATMEIAGNLDIHAKSYLVNYNEPYQAEERVKQAATRRVFIQPNGQAQRYSKDELDWANWSRAGLYRHRQSGAEIKNFHQFEVDQTVQESQILKSQPARIIVGGDLTLRTEQATNDKSQVIVGGTLKTQAAEFNNLAALGINRLQERGTRQYSYEEWRGGFKRYHQRNWHDKQPYQPPDIVTTITLPVMRYQSQAGAQTQSQTLPQNAAPLTVINSHVPAATEQQVRSGGLNLALPTHPLFQKKASEKSFLIGLDTSFKVSDAVSTAMPENLAQWRQTYSRDHPHLGDASYEQQLIKEQVIALTGQRFINQHRYDDQQRLALWQAGWEFAQATLAPAGQALSPEQMARVTKPMVWPVAYPINLGDGQIQTAIAPQVYVVNNANAVNGGDTLIAAQQIDLSISNTFKNSGTISAKESQAVQAAQITHSSGRLHGDDVQLHASGEIHVLGGTIDAQQRAQLHAGGDLTIASSTQENNQGNLPQLANNQAANQQLDSLAAPSSNGGNQYAQRLLDQVASIRINNPEGELILQAGRDVALNAAHIQSLGSAHVNAGQDIHLNPIQTQQQQYLNTDPEHFLRTAQADSVGSTLHSQHDMTLVAQQDLIAQAAHIHSAQGEISLEAGRDMQLTAGQRARAIDSGHTYHHSDFLSDETKITRDTSVQQQALGTVVSGQTITLNAGRDIQVEGGQIVSDQGTQLTAAHDIKLAGSQQRQAERHFAHQEESGLLSDGGFSLTLGNRDETQVNTVDQQDLAPATVGSVQGNVQIQAGGNYQQQASHISAPQGDIAIQAQDILITADSAQQQSTLQHDVAQSGLMVGVSQPIVAAAQTALRMGSAAVQTDDPRLTALAGASAALAAKNAADTVISNPVNLGGIQFAMTLGESEQHSHSKQQQSQTQPATIQAGDQLYVDGDNVSVHGSHLQADHIQIDAQNTIHLSAATETKQQQAQHTSASHGMGASINVGFNGIAAGATVQHQAGKGYREQQQTQQQPTTLVASKTVMLNSAGDTTLSGASIAGPQIRLEVGGDLSLTSTQDTMQHQSRDQILGGSVTAGIGAAGSVHVQRQALDAEYASVKELTGIRAGEGGFQINVKGHTALNGAVITSSQAGESQNQLATATLSSTNIKNREQIDAKQLALSGGLAQAGGLMGLNTAGQADATQPIPGTVLAAIGQDGQGLALAPLIVLSATDKQSSTTKSGISPAAITITDDAKQQALTGKNGKASIDHLNREVSTDTDSSQALTPKFDEDKIKSGFAIASTFSQEVGQFLTHRALEAAENKKQLLAEQAKPIEQQDAHKITQLSKQIANNAKWETGGVSRRVLTATTAAISGKVLGSANQLVQLATIGYVQGLAANEVKQIADSLGPDPAAETVRVALHAIVGCAVAAATSQNCLAGAQGAAAASLLGSIMSDTNQLNAGQKEARRNLVATIVGGVADVIGDHAATATAAAIREAKDNQLRQALMPPPLPMINPIHPSGPVGVPGKPIQPDNKDDGIIADPFTEIEQAAGIIETPNLGPQIKLPIYTPVSIAHQIFELVKTMVVKEFGNKDQDTNSLKFEPASYHGAKDNLLKSRGPRNGQETLEYSLQVKETSPRRIGIDSKTKDFVVFDRTFGNVYHGHVRAWNDLTNDMQNVLIRSKKVDKSGNIKE